MAAGALEDGRSCVGWKKITKATVNKDGVQGILSHHFLNGVIHCGYVLLGDCN